MNNRNFIILVSSVFLTLSCGFYDRLEREELVSLQGDYPLLVMNGQMDAGKESHVIRLYTSVAQVVEPVRTPSVNIALNGSEIDWEASSDGAEFDALFNPGDIFTVKAGENGLSVVSEAVVPHEATILSCETGLEDGVLHCRVTLQDRPGEKNYYRIGRAVFECSYIHNSYGHTTPYSVVKDIEVDTSGDPVINSGFSSEALDEISLFMPENKWSIFTDKEFADGTVTLKIDVRVGYLQSEINSVKESYTMDLDSEGNWVKETYNSDISADIILKIYSISEMQYQYLKAVTTWDNFDYEVHPLAESAPVPSNVTGGLGVIAIDMPATYRLEGILGKY